MCHISGPNKPSEANPKLMIPLFDIIFPFLPEKILKPLRFGVKYEEVSYVLLNLFSLRMRSHTRL